MYPASLDSDIGFVPSTSIMPDLQQPAQPAETEYEPRLPLHTFPPPIVIPPLDQPHERTVIFLHGRGSSARIFAPPFLSTPVIRKGEPSSDEGDPETLRAALPNTRFVFPTAPRSRATIYRRSIINQWYDGSGDWEETVLGHARETVRFVHDLLREEASLVGGAGRVVLGGISQGCAAALVCLLLWDGEPLGGLVGMCGMLPMAGVLGDTIGESHENRDETECDGGGDGEEIEDIFGSTDDEGPDPFDHGEDESPCSQLLQALNLLREEIGLPYLLSDQGRPFQKTPMFLGHGTEDDRVLLRYGQDASRVLRMMRCDVEFRCYDGLGHWYSEEMLGHVLDFLCRKGFITSDVKGSSEVCT